jgi:metal-sulfur cluster biosynthetic enzyme
MPSELVQKVTQRLNELVDEETSRKFGELNIVSDISEVSDGMLYVRFSPLSPYSPIAVDTGKQIKNASLQVDGVRGVRVECSGHMMDDLVNRLVNRD